MNFHAAVMYMFAFKDDQRWEMNKNRYRIIELLFKNFCLGFLVINLLEICKDILSS